MKYGKTTILLAWIMILVSSASIASAVAAGISPATLSFSIPRGGEDTQTVEISTNSEIPLAFSVSLDRSLNDTITFEVLNKETSKGKPGRIRVTAHSLRSSEPRTIEGAITAVINMDNAEPSESGSRIATAVAARISLEVTNDKVPLIKNKLAFATWVLVIILVILAAIYFVKRKKK